MTNSELQIRYNELHAKMSKVKTRASKDKYLKLMLDLTNQYRLSNGLNKVG